MNPTRAGSASGRVGFGQGRLRAGSASGRDVAWPIARVLGGGRRAASFPPISPGKNGRSESQAEAPDRPGEASVIPDPLSVAEHAVNLQHSACHNEVRKVTSARSLSRWSNQAFCLSTELVSAASFPWRSAAGAAGLVQYSPGR